MNVCSDENIKDASPRTDVKKSVSKGRIAWAIPYSTTKPRRDLDKAGQKCMVYDVIFNPNVIKRTQTNFGFRDMVNTTALEGVENAFKLKLDRKRLRFPRLQFKGKDFENTVALMETIFFWNYVNWCKNNKSCLTTLLIALKC